MRVRALGRAWAVAATLALAYAGVVACGSEPQQPPPDQEADVATLTDFTATHPEWLTRDHVTGRIDYPMSPPAGGNHNPIWQNCAGDVYDAPIANEHAVHSLEHGAVWVTYRPDLPAAGVAALAKRVRDRNYLMMSPYPGLPAPISLQAWGYQLTVGKATNPAIDTFIRDHRAKGEPEPGAPCSGGLSGTGTEPLNPPG